MLVKAAVIRKALLGEAETIETRQTVSEASQ